MRKRTLKNLTAVVTSSVLTQNVGLMNFTAFADNDTDMTSASYITEYEPTGNDVVSIESNQNTSIEGIRDLLISYIKDNSLDAKTLSNKEYPDYQPIVIEYTAESAANKAILEYAQISNIDLSNVGFVPIVNGVAITTVNPDVDIATTQTTTTAVEKEIPEVTDMNNAVKIYNVPIRFAFTEYSNIDDILASEELLGFCYVIEQTDGSLSFYNENFHVITQPVINNVESSLKVFNDKEFVKNYISDKAELKDSYFLSGESSLMGTVIYFRTTVGDFVYYNHYDIGKKLFPIDDFCKYQQAIMDEIAKNPDSNGGINIGNIWDLSPYTIKKIDTPVSTTATIASSADDTTIAKNTSTTTSAVSKPTITIEDIIRLSKKGESLTWSDFEKYEYTDIGSGLIVLKFNVKNCNGELIIGGGGLAKNPEYIDFCFLDSDRETDIRTEDFEQWFYNGETTTSTSPDTAESSPTTTTTTPTTTNANEELPQTGYSNLYKLLTGLASLMTVTGVAIVVKTRKENE